MRSLPYLNFPINEKIVFLVLVLVLRIHVLCLKVDVLFAGDNNYGQLGLGHDNATDPNVTTLSPVIIENIFISQSSRCFYY